MSSVDNSQVKAEVEQILAEVNVRLDAMILKDTTLMIANDEDVMHERLFAFCDEMEALKRKIANQRLDLSDRIECVGDISQYLKDLMIDIADYKLREESTTLSHGALSILSQIEVGLRMISPDITVIEDTLLSTPHKEIEAYFDSKQSQLKSLLASHPELGVN